MGASIVSNWQRTRVDRERAGARVNASCATGHDCGAARPGALRASLRHGEQADARGTGAEEARHHRGPGRGAQAFAGGDRNKADQAASEVSNAYGTRTYFDTRLREVPSGMGGTMSGIEKLTDVVLRFVSLWLTETESASVLPKGMFRWKAESDAITEDYYRDVDVE